MYQKASPKYDEPLLEMGHAIYLGHWYLVNGHPVRSEVTGNCQTLLDDLKLTGEDSDATEVYKCDAVARELPLLSSGLKAKDIP